MWKIDEAIENIKDKIRKVSPEKEPEKFSALFEELLAMEMGKNQARYELLLPVVSGYVKLEKAGRLYKGLCPFHKEKTPSFLVDPDKQLYHCFACGEGGSVYTFIMKLENLSFLDSVKLIGNKLQNGRLVMPYENNSPKKR